MTIIDVLRRAGIAVVVAGLPGTIVKGSRDVKIITETNVEDVSAGDFDGIILPGGNPGYLNLSRSKKIISLITELHKSKKLVAAICAAPVVLAQAGILQNVRATCYPGMEKSIPMPRNASVLADGNIITSQGPGTAMEFALKIVEYLAGKAKMENVKQQLVFKG